MQIRINTEELARVEAHLQDVDLRVEVLRQKVENLSRDMAVIESERSIQRAVIGVIFTAVIANFVAVLFSRRQPKYFRNIRREFEQE